MTQAAQANERTGTDFQRTPRSIYEAAIRILTEVFLWLEFAINKIISFKYNPLYYHGALPQFFLWVLLFSGLFLFAYYIPTIDNAYVSKNLVNAWTSVDFITDKLPFGAVIRGIHRYAGDGMVLAIFLHMIRVWFTDRYRQYRWVQWLTGVALLAVVLFIGQTGYYLVWDVRSLWLTRATVSAFDYFSGIGLGAPLKALFINGPAITNLTLSNFLFIHIGLSFFLLFGLWLHYVRMTRPVITPPPAINYILVAIILAFVFRFPINSGSMADLNQIPPATFKDFDWWFLWPYALMSSVPLGMYWLLIIGGAIILCVIPAPWAALIKTKPVEAAEVVLNKCTGCSLCSRDCPYQAIEMVPAPAGSRFKLLAVVAPQRCSGCGVCVGACAFDAIDLPELLDTNVTTQIKQLVEAK